MGIKMVIEVDKAFKPEIDREDYKERIKAFNKTAYSQKEAVFSKVMKNIYRAPEGHYTADPQPIFDGKRWHLFYVTGQTKYADIWIDLFKNRQFAEAAKVPYEEIGDGHAIGDTLFDLKYNGRIMTEVQGEYSSLLQGDGFVMKHEDRWVYVVSNRGPKGQSMGLAYSANADMTHWTSDPDNPFWLPPPYAKKGMCAGAYIVPYGDRFLIYYMLTSAIPANGVGLISTKDFRTFDDHGLVFIIPSMARGTVGLESPCVVHRNGMWHLFFGSGTGWWHTVSDVPDNFMGPQDWDREQALYTGMYNMGPFHASRVVHTTDDKWYLMSTYKEEHRRLNRENGNPAPRGSMNDEGALLKGVFLSQIEWQDDFPVLLEW